MKTIITSLIMALSFGFVINNADAQNAQEKIPNGKLQSSFVCYVNNNYMGKEQIPVEVEGKTYYGCCMGCVGNLKKNRKVRYAQDPLTNEEVDKSTAFIVLKSDTGAAVQYFANAENYAKYKSKNAKP